MTPPPTTLLLNNPLETAFLSHSHHAPHHRRSRSHRHPKAETTGAAVAAVPLSHPQVRQIAQELFAYLPENKLGLLSIGFMAGGAAGLWLKDSHAERVSVLV